MAWWSFAFGFDGVTSGGGGGGGDGVNLDNEYEIFSIIASGTTGTISPPNHGSIVLDQYPGAGDCLVLKVDPVSNRPIDDPARTVAGAIVTSTFNGAGDYVLSGTPSAYPVALVYQVVINDQYKAANLPNSSILNETLFTGSSVISHNSTGGLQGGTTGEYYHLTAAQVAALGSGGGSSNSYMPSGW